jgi:hypothetical protein
MNLLFNIILLTALMSYRRPIFLVSAL